MRIRNPIPHSSSITNWLAAASVEPARLDCRLIRMSSGHPTLSPTGVAGEDRVHATKFVGKIDPLGRRPHGCGRNLRDRVLEAMA